MRPKHAAVAAVTAAVLAGLAPAQFALALGNDNRVSVGSASAPFSQNKQNEPALTVDAHDPTVLASGANDEIDMEACNAGDRTTCPFTQGVGVSGVYFSFDSGSTWTQPTYTGVTARGCLGPQACTTTTGPIGTLPGYAEKGLVSDGDPALAFGPRRGANGRFSWDNGSRLYYANLASNLGTARSEATFKGYEALAVSRTDDVRAAAAGDATAWKSPVLISKQSATTFSDKEQIWADNAATSPYFGNVYVCSADFRSNSQGNALPTPLVIARSQDGGDTWTTMQVGPATDNGQRSQPDGCTVRTDSAGRVYVFGIASSHGRSYEAMYRSTDGGRSYAGPTSVANVVAPGVIDPVLGRPTLDGIAGARSDLAPAPSVDIANGAPSGADATDEIVMSFTDGTDGLNHERALTTWSTSHGLSWATPVAAQEAGDRSYLTAPALSPNGTDAWLVYNAFTTDYRRDTSSPRSMVAVVRHADVAADGTIGSWTTVHRADAGDPRASSQNSLQAGFLGDYVYAVASRTFGSGVWNDVRNGADCPAIDAWRLSLSTGTTVTQPSPQVDCPSTFGNTDIYGGTYLDPTP